MAEVALSSNGVIGGHLGLSNYYAIAFSSLASWNQFFSFFFLFWRVFIRLCCSYQLQFIHYVPLHNS